MPFNVGYRRALYQGAGVRGAKEITQLTFPSQGITGSAQTVIFNTAGLGIGGATTQLETIQGWDNEGWTLSDESTQVISLFLFNQQFDFYTGSSNPGGGIGVSWGPVYWFITTQQQAMEQLRDAMNGVGFNASAYDGGGGNWVCEVEHYVGFGCNISTPSSYVSVSVTSAGDPVNVTPDAQITVYDASNVPRTFNLFTFYGDSYGNWSTALQTAMEITGDFSLTFTGIDFESVHIANTGTGAASSPYISGVPDMGIGVESAGVTTVTNVGAGEYFNISSPSTAYKIWFKVGASGSAPGGGGTKIEVDIAAAASNTTVAAAVKTALDAISGTPFSTSRASNVLTVTNSLTGAATDASNGTITSGFSVSVTTQGS